MGFFIDTEKTKKIYFDNKMNISEKKTDNWVEIKEQPSFYLIDELKNETKPKHMTMNAKTYQVELDTEKLGKINLNLLAKIIVNWSEDEKISVDTLKTKVNAIFIEKLWIKILDEYGINQDVAGA